MAKLGIGLFYRTEPTGCVNDACSKQKEGKCRLVKWKKVATRFQSGWSHTGTGGAAWARASVIDPADL